MQEAAVSPVARLMALINRKDWWHVPPGDDPTAYEQRGMFLASSYREAEFWGRPLDTPLHVEISNPIVGDEATIETALLGKRSKTPSLDSPHLLEWRWKLDAQLKEAALAKGFDSIILFSPVGYGKYVAEGKLPRSIELNLLRKSEQVKDHSQD